MGYNDWNSVSVHKRDTELHNQTWISLAFLILLGFFSFPRLSLSRLSICKHIVQHHWMNVVYTYRLYVLHTNSKSFLTIDSLNVCVQSFTLMYTKTLRFWNAIFKEDKRYFSGIQRDEMSKEILISITKTALEISNHFMTHIYLYIQTTTTNKRRHIARTHIRVWNGFSSVCVQRKTIYFNAELLFHMSVDNAIRLLWNHRKIPFQTRKEKLFKQNCRSCILFGFFCHEGTRCLLSCPVKVQ